MWLIAPDIEMWACDVVALHLCFAPVMKICTCAAVAVRL